MSPRTKAPTFADWDDYVAWKLAQAEGWAAAKPHFAPRVAELRAHAACEFTPLSESARAWLDGVTEVCPVCGWTR